jgi:hypothetical protein
MRTSRLAIAALLVAVVGLTAALQMRTTRAQDQAQPQAQPQAQQRRQLAVVDRANGRDAEFTYRNLAAGDTPRVVTEGILALDADVSIKASHDGNYYVYVIVRRADDADAVVGEHRFEDAALHADDVLVRRCIWGFELPKGDYEMEVGVMDRAPTVTRDGQLLREESRMGMERLYCSVR